MERLRTAWKYLLSWFKNEWSLDDYPIRIRAQPEGENVPRYVAQVIEWWALVGIGETPEEALDDLATNFAAYKENHPLPRPGTAVPITFAATDGIEAHAETADRFFIEVMGFRPDHSVFISDLSSLDDFETRCERDEAVARIQEIFGVDVSDIGDGNLLRIFQRIDRAK